MTQISGIRLESGSPGTSEENSASSRHRQAWSCLCFHVALLLVELPSLHRACFCVSPFFVAFSACILLGSPSSPEYPPSRCLAPGFRIGQLRWKYPRISFFVLSFLWCGVDEFVLMALDVEVFPCRSDFLFFFYDFIDNISVFFWRIYFSPAPIALIVPLSVISSFVFRCCFVPSLCCCWGYLRLLNFSSSLLSRLSLCFVCCFFSLSSSADPQSMITDPIPVFLVTGCSIQTKRARSTVWLSWECQNDEYRHLL